MIKIIAWLVVTLVFYLFRRHIDRANAASARLRQFTIRMPYAPSWVASREAHLHVMYGPQTVLCRCAVVTRAGL